MYVRTDSETHAILTCEDAQEEGNRNTLNILKTFLLLFAEDSGKIKAFSIFRINHK